jgi:preprotein translocase subunit SecD
MAGIFFEFGGSPNDMRRYTFTLIAVITLILIAIWIVLPNNPGIHIAGINRDIQTRLGLDLVGGVQALLEADLPAESEVTQEAMSTATRIVENRVNGLGVAEAVVQQAGDRRIVVELPGETDPERALSTIRETGLLEFVDLSELSDSEISALLAANEKIQTDFGLSTPITSTLQADGSKIYKTVMTGAVLKTAQATRSSLGEIQVAFELTPDGAELFKNYTRDHIGSVLAIVLDKQIVSAPVIQSEIPDGQGVISGSFDLEGANSLAIQLRYGALPIPIKIQSSTTVGPTLGEESLQKSLLAGIIGVIVVILYMGLYYRLPGIVADIALLIYILLTFAIFKLIPITFTTPGIAGYILSIGVAVDANVLIFERMKEELRAGRTIHQATDLGWSRAWSSIRDSNFSTLITCLILFWFGSTFGASMVKGFSVTLAIGVGVSMFTAIIVTRTLIHIILDRVEFKEHRRWFGL